MWTHVLAVVYPSGFPKIVKEAESIRLGIITEDDSIRMTVDTRVKSVHLDSITETESTILTATMETELLRGMLCFMRAPRVNSSQYLRMGLI